MNRFSNLNFHKTMTMLSIDHLQVLEALAAILNAVIVITLIFKQAV